ncbi:MAG: methionine synthase [Corynebacterium flavescens]|uniref:methionine synthase n=1 Tax=Corynebacterium flavescens TaxID=28028 RepID=UPI003F8E61D3
MTGFGLGVLPGTSMKEAAEIVMGESGVLPCLPQLPQRGLGSDAVGRTAGLLEAVNVDRGPRSWQLTPRPQLLTRRTWDRMERDLDEIQESWGESVPQVKTQIVGPFSLAAAVELPNGHRVLTDPGAFRDLNEALHLGLEEHVAELKRRFHGEVKVQLDEPLLGRVLFGRLRGTTDFETIRAVPREVTFEILAAYKADFLRLETPLWEIATAAATVLVDFAGLGSNENLEGLGTHLEAGRRVGLGLTPGDPRASAIEIARHLDHLGLSRDYLTTDVDVFPTQVRDAPRDLAFATRLAEILERDAGDL